MTLRNVFLIAIIMILFASCNPQLQNLQSDQPPKNIILLIGDGMGLAQVSSSFYFQDKKPSFTRFKHIGLLNTSSDAQKVTDSASSATAYATGKRTYNGAIGVDMDTVNLKNIVEHLSPKGFSTGVISTSSIVHATPASFYAHSPSRNYYEYIASQLATSEIDFFAGGGIQFFAKRTDGENQLNNLLQAGFLVDTTTLDAFGELEAGNKYGFLLADDGMPKMSEGRGEFLLNATEMAIEHLSKDEDGFFLMVEGSQIDWAGHANDARWLISEVLDFDKVINAALDFAKKDGNTLVIVTADHETGGFSLSAAEVRRQAYYANIQPTFSTGHHSASLVPIFAYGPGAERFQGVYNNSEVYTRMLKALKK